MKKRSTKTVKKVLKFLLPAICLFLQCRIVNGQNAFRSGDGWGSGWTTNNYYSLGLFGTSAGWSFTNSNGGTPSNRYFRFYSQVAGCNTEWGPNGGADVQMTFNTSLTLTSGTSKAYYVYVPNATNNYVFKTKQWDACSSPQAVVFEIQGTVRSVSSVSLSPSTVYHNQSATVTATLSGSFSTGQAVYLRYSTDNFSTSTVVQMSGSGTSYSASIPAATNSSGTTVKYYVFSFTTLLMEKRLPLPLRSGA